MRKQRREGGEMGLLPGCAKALRKQEWGYVAKASQLLGAGQEMGQRGASGTTPNMWSLVSH